MAEFLYKGDLPDGLSLGPVVAIDSETMGLNIGRDRLCLVHRIRLDFLDRAIYHFRDRRFKAKITNQKPETKKHDHEHEQNSKGNDAFDG